jgi:hypothetical protein
MVLGDVNVMVTVHVDDFASTGDGAAVTEYRRRLYERFPCTGGLIKGYYGLDVLIDRKKGVTKLSASSYVKRMLKKLGIKVSTPMVLDVELKKPCPQKGQNKTLQVFFCFLAGYYHGWIGHKPGSGFSDLAPSILHYDWF